MKKTAAVAFCLLSITMAVPVRHAAYAQGNTPNYFVPPAVFQAAGPTAASIQGTVDAYRAALGAPNNANNAGPLASGRREINWDGGGADDTTTAPVTPFNVFLNTRGGQFTTPGTGLSQAPPSGGPQGGLAGLFGNPTYGTIFSTFSPLRLFTPVGSNVTETLFFIPGTNGADPGNGQRLRRGLHGRRPAGWEWPWPEARQPRVQHADRVLRGRRRAVVQQLRPRLAGRWEPVLLRRRLRRGAHRPGADHERRRRAGAG